MNHSLTPREWEVAELITNGYSNHDISEILVISKATTKTHVNNIYRKLDIYSSSRKEIATMRVQVALWYLNVKGLIKR